jgi:hypothetical protein
MSLFHQLASTIAMRQAKPVASTGFALQHIMVSKRGLLRKLVLAAALMDCIHEVPSSNIAGIPTILVEGYLDFLSPSRRLSG